MADFYYFFFSQRLLKELAISNSRFLDDVKRIEAVIQGNENAHLILGQSWKACHNQGCQMEYFNSKNTNFGKFERTLEWKMFQYFIAICNNLCR
jgi:hypothetical protein